MFHSSELLPSFDPQKDGLESDQESALKVWGGAKSSANFDVVAHDLLGHAVQGQPDEESAV